MDKVCARWVPRILRQEEKYQRVVAPMEFLRHFERERESFFGHIIITDTH